MAEAPIRFLREADVSEGQGPPVARIFLADVDRLDLSETDFRRLLPSGELQRADRFHTPALRRSRLAAWAILRTILGRHLDVPPRSIDIKRSELGKPYISGGPSFNLSHSGSLVLVALRPAGRLGVDIEVRRSSADLESLAHRFFTQEEWEDVRKDPAEISLAFHRTWVRKEALLKALGTGLQTPLNRFRVNTGILPEGRNALRWMDIEGETRARWMVTPLTVPPAAEAAIAWDDA